MSTSQGRFGIAVNEGNQLKRLNKKQSLGRFLTAAWLLMLVSLPVYAYVGPGAGLSAIGSLLALGLALLAAFIGFIWYPLKRLRQKRKGDGIAEPTIEPAATESVADGKVDNTASDQSGTASVPENRRGS